MISLANTQEPLYLVNRSGNRPSHEGAAFRFDQAIGLCRRAGFRQVLLRGDTDFSQTRHLDGWDDQDVGFIFGIDAMSNLKVRPRNWNRASGRAWNGRQIRGGDPPRRRPDNVKEQVVRERGFENIRLRARMWPSLLTGRVPAIGTTASSWCGRICRWPKGSRCCSTTSGTSSTSRTRPEPADQIVMRANQRCNQENLIEQLKNGVQALRMPVGDQTSNWAYMVMASLAWTLKAWFALLLPETGRWGQKYQAEKQTVLHMEFKTFRNAFMLVPCQLVRTGRRIVFRVLAWNRWLPVLFRAVDVLRQPLRC